MRTWHVISIIAKNKPQSHHKAHLHTIKGYNTRPVSQKPKLSSQDMRGFGHATILIPSFHGLL